MVRLESDVAEAFPTADAVNEALRFLIRITKKINHLPAGREADRNITRRLTSACMGFEQRETVMGMKTANIC